MDTITRVETEPEAILEDGVRDYAHRLQTRLAEMDDAITCLRHKLEPILSPDSCATGLLDGATPPRAPMVEHLDGLLCTLTAQMAEVHDITRRVVL